MCLFSRIAPDVMVVIGVLKTAIITKVARS